MRNICAKSATSHDHTDSWIPCFQSSNPQRVLYHPQSLQFVQEYIFIHCNPLSNQMQYYQYRKRPNLNLVNIVYAEIRENIYKVWVEYMPCRLDNLLKINMIEALVIIINAQRGFKSILQLYGEVKIVQEMIGINRFGQVKVWLSKYFNYNHPHPEQIEKRDSKRAKDSQLNMISQIMKLVCQHLQERDLRSIVPITKKSRTFAEFEQAILKFVQQNRISLPQRLDLKSLNITEETIPFIRCLDDNFQIPNRPQEIHNLLTLARKTVSVDNQYLLRRKRLSLNQIPADGQGVSAQSSNLPTPNTYPQNQMVNSKKNLILSKSKDKKNKRSNTEPQGEREEELLVHSSIRVEESKQLIDNSKKPLQFDQQKLKKFKKELKPKIDSTQTKQYQQKDQLLVSTVKKSHQPSSRIDFNLSATVNKSRQIKNLSFTESVQVLKPQALTQRIPQLFFTERPKRSLNKSIKKKKDNNEKQIYEITTRIQSIAHPQSSYEYYKIQIKDQPTQANGIEAQFQQFLKSSQRLSGSSRNRRGKGIPSLPPPLQFSKIKPTKIKVYNQSKKKFEYSSFYVKEVNTLNEYSRAQTSREKISQHALNTYKSNQNMEGKNNIISNSRVQSRL